MKSVFFNTDVLTAEKNIIDGLCIPSLILMENAGKNSAEIIIKEFEKSDAESVTVLCGKGSNAGDGFVIARHLLLAGISVSVILLYPAKVFKGDAEINFSILEKLRKDYPLRIVYAGSFGSFKKHTNSRFTFYVDAVFGIGFKGTAETKIRTVFHYINNQKNKFVVSVDTPSGLSDINPNSDVVNADLTISMGVRKFACLVGQGKTNSGKIETVDIGIPVEEFSKQNKKKIYIPEAKDLKCFIPVRKKNSNKYTNGKLFILAGSEGFTGAAYLCSLSALRTGCGAVILGIPSALNTVMERKTTEVITLPLQGKKYFNGDAYKGIQDKLKWADAVLIGPGIGRNPETLALVRNVYTNTGKNIVLDADGIFAFRGNPELLKRRRGKTVLTPHYGEFAGLLGISVEDLKKDLYNISLNFAREFKVILVLKNSPTVITDGQYFIVNPTGSENLATVGTGDVLAGITAGLLASNHTAWGSALLAVYLHGLCGDMLYSEQGSSSTIASDLIEKIQFAKKNILDS